MLTSEQFPLILNTAGSADRASHYVNAIIEIVNEAEQIGSIVNPKFKDAKDKLNRLIDVIFDRGGVYQEVRSYAYRIDLSYYQANHIAGKLKLAKKLNGNSLLSTFISLSEELLVLFQAIESFKDKVVKRAARSEEERSATYVPPIPTDAASKKAYGILKELTDSLIVKYEETLFDWFVGLVERRFANPKQRNDRSPVTYADNLIQTVGTNWDSFNGNYTALKADWKDILRTKANIDADYAQRLFCYKNTLKLATILEKKGNLSATTIQSGEVNQAGFLGQILFTFADGSSFVFKTKVVSKYSVHGTYFHQFPSTFHAATLPSGNRLPGQPSEQEMIEIFSVKK